MTRRSARSIFICYFLGRSKRSHLPLGRGTGMSAWDSLSCQKFVAIGSFFANLLNLIPPRSQQNAAFALDIDSMSGQEQNWPVTLENVLGSAQCEKFRPFDVHFDEVWWSDPGAFYQRIQTCSRNQCAPVPC